MSHAHELSIYCVKHVIFRNISNLLQHIENCEFVTYILPYLKCISSRIGLYIPRFGKYVISLQSINPISVSAITVFQWKLLKG